MFFYTGFGEYLATHWVSSAKGESISTSHAINDGQLTTEQAYMIDSKMDDGLPATGIIRHFIGMRYSFGHHFDKSSFDDNCFINDTDNAYNLTFKDPACYLSYDPGLRF